MKETRDNEVVRGKGREARGQCHFEIQGTFLRQRRTETRKGTVDLSGTGSYLVVGSEPLRARKESLLRVTE